MIVHHVPPWTAFLPISTLEFMPFRDAGRGAPDFSLSIADCLWGIHKAMATGLLDMNAFRVEEYEYYEKVENGDWNWIGTGFIAFASPVEPGWGKRLKEGKENVKEGSAKDTALQRKLSPSFHNVLTYFSTHNVQLVVRLNNMLYSPSHFTSLGIRHEELYFDDGTNPSDEIVRKFIDLCEEIFKDGGVVAVHVSSFSSFPIVDLIIPFTV